MEAGTGRKQGEHLPGNQAKRQGETRAESQGHGTRQGIPERMRQGGRFARPLGIQMPSNLLGVLIGALEGQQIGETLHAVVDEFPQNPLTYQLLIS